MSRSEKMGTLFLLAVLTWAGLIALALFAAQCLQLSLT